MLFEEVASLVIFCLVILCTILLVLFPVSLPLPSCLSSTCCLKLPAAVPVHYSSVPVLGVLAMLATGSLSGAELAKGIVGDDALKPYGIVILFLDLSYISISLDMTGCFGWLALHITRLSRGRGRLLFLLYFMLSSVITIFTSNDIAIMTLTPIIYYFAAATSTDPIPFLTAEFTAANIWSMLLFIGNPTNIIVAMAYQMSFAEYSKWMALPTLCAGLSCLAALLLVHLKSIPERLVLPDLQPALMLVDAPGAVLGSANILACLALLAAAPSLGWELWLVTLVCAGLHVLYNCTAYVVCKGRWCRQLPAEAPAQVEAAGAGAGAAVQLVHAGKDAACEVEAQCVAAGTEADKGQAASSARGLIAAAQEQEQQQHQHRKEAHQQIQHVGQAQQPAQAAAAAAGSSSPSASCRRLPALSPSAAEEHAETVPAPARAAAAASGAGASIGGTAGTAARTAAAGAGAVGNACSTSLSEADVQVSIHGSTSSLLLLPVAKHQPGLSQQKASSGCDGNSGSGGSSSGRNRIAAAAGAGATGPLHSEQSQGPAFGLLAQVKQPSFWRVLQLLPWEVPPFILGMFILVEGLNATGWVDRLAMWLASGIQGSVWAALFAVGSLSVLLANLANNQPMTILMTRVCLSPALTQTAAAGLTAASSRVPLAAAFAVVIASNVAANYTVMGALAGIMFVNILQRKGLKGIGYLTFSKLMLPAGVISTVAALAVLGAELVAWQ